MGTFKVQIRPLNTMGSRLQMVGRCGILVPRGNREWVQHIPRQKWAHDWVRMSVVPLYLEVACILLVQESELGRHRHEAANTAAEVVHIDGRHEH